MVKKLAMHWEKWEGKKAQIVSVLYVEQTSAFSYFNVRDYKEVYPKVCSAF